MEENSSEVQAPRFSLKARRAVSSASADLVRFELPTAGTLPVVARPATDDVDLCTWAEIERERVDRMLLDHGAILFRGFDIRSASQFERFIKATSGEPLPYVERSSPRTPVSGHIYSSTEYPAEHAIFLHCENSYQKSWPLRIFFYCALPAENGGETPIADTRRILARIDPTVRHKFAQKGVAYVRNFGTGLGLPWRTVFQAEERFAVEQYCSRAGIECVWEDADRLRTEQVRKAIRTHPVTGEPVWFNHAVFFHVSTLPSTTREVLQTTLAEEDLPNNTYYGDGSNIEAEVLDQLRAVYREETVCFPWHRDDVLMLDNMLVAHGRLPYAGARKVLVGMAQPISADDELSGSNDQTCFL